MQHRLSGPAAPFLLETLTPTSTSSLAPGHSTLSVLLHPRTGGIVDDTIITRLPPNPSSQDPSFYLVTNAACRDKDLAYLSSNITSLGLAAEVQWEVLEDWGLIALQGPLAKDILGEFFGKRGQAQLETMYFGQSASFKIPLPDSDNGETSVPCLVSRGGYTGEDGFEISIPPSQTSRITAALLDSGRPDRLRLAGLGARDSLRLEAGMCLYGHDLDDTTTPVEAGLAWVIPKSRRTDGNGAFYGAETILPQLKLKKDGGTGVTRRRVGLIVEGAPAREGAEIVSDAAEVLGRITSGCPSPSLGRNIAMGYVRNGYHKAGTEVGVVVRGKRRRAEVVKMPFVETRYWRER